MDCWVKVHAVDVLRIQLNCAIDAMSTFRSESLVLLRNSVAPVAPPTQDPRHLGR